MPDAAEEALVEIDVETGEIRGIAQERDEDGNVVPELVDGVVEIRAVAREPGHRTKLAVASNDQNVDPVGACVGARGMRVRQVVNELRGEKVDIVPFSADSPEFVMRALAPAK